jgi:hypothetical protein
MTWTRSRSQLIGHPGAEFLTQKIQRKKKEPKKKEKACGNAVSEEIRRFGFPQRLGKAFGFTTFPQARLGYILIPVSQRSIDHLR